MGISSSQPSHLALMHQGLFFVCFYCFIFLVITLYMTKLSVCLVWVPRKLYFMSKNLIITVPSMLTFCSKAHIIIL